MDEIRYAWVSKSIGEPVYHVNWYMRVEDPGWFHRDWDGKLCGGTFVYAHNHSYFPHIAWWECSLCTRKVCGYRPEPLFQAVAKAVRAGV